MLPSFIPTCLRDGTEDAGENNWQECFQYQERLNFKITQVTTRRKAFLEISDIVKKMKKDEPGPTMMVIQSSQRNLLAS